jgi:superkiller protein 3
MGDKWESFKTKVKAKFKQYGPLLLKYGLPIAIGLATGGAGAIAGILPSIVAAVKKQFNLGEREGSDSSIGELLVNFSKEAYEKLKSDKAIPQPALEGLQELADNIQELAREVRKEKADVAELLDAWGDEFGRQLRLNFEITWDKIDAFKAAVLDGLKELSGKVDEHAVASKQDHLDIKARLDLITNMLSDGKGRGKEIDVEIFSSSITSILDEVAQIAPGSENEPFESLNPHMFMAGDIAAMKQMSSMLAGFTSADLRRIGNEQVWYRLGRLMYKIKAFSDAIIFSRAAIATKPDFSKAWITLGNALGDSGDKAGAIDAFRKAAQTGSNDAKAWITLGSALGDSGDKTGAIDAFRKAAQTWPDDAEAWNNLGGVLSDSGDNKGATDAFRKAVQIEPTNFKAWYSLGRALYALDDKKGATDAFSKAAQIAPNNPKALSAYGGMLAESGDKKGGTEAVRKAIQIGSDDAKTWQTIGWALSSLGYGWDAVEAYNKATQIEPNDAEAWNNLGYAYRRAFRFREAKEAFQKATEVAKETDPKKKALEKKEESLKRDTAADSQLNYARNLGVEPPGDSLKRDTAADSQPSTTPEETETITICCPVCSKPVKPGSHFCMRCGEKLL